MKLFVKEFESIIEKLNAEGKPYWAVSKEEGNRTLLTAYHQSKERGNNLVDFNEVVSEKDVEPIASSLRSAGVKEFTFSSRMTGAIEILAEFKKLNVEVKELVSVKGYDGGEIPAMLLVIR